MFPWNLTTDTIDLTFERGDGAADDNGTVRGINYTTSNPVSC